MILLVLAYAASYSDPGRFYAWTNYSHSRICEPHCPEVFGLIGIYKNNSHCSWDFGRFAINLQCGPNTNPRDDLALHFNPRFQERAVVRNSLIMGQWGHEERHGHFPFIPGQGFELLLLADSQQQYKVTSPLFEMWPYIVLYVTMSDFAV